MEEVDKEALLQEEEVEEALQIVLLREQEVGNENHLPLEVEGKKALLEEVGGREALQMALQMALLLGQEVHRMTLTLRREAPQMLEGVEEAQENKVCLVKGEEFLCHRCQFWAVVGAAAGRPPSLLNHWRQLQERQIFV